MYYFTHACKLYIIANLFFYINQKKIIIYNINFLIKIFNMKLIIIIKIDAIIEVINNKPLKLFFSLDY